MDRTSLTAALKPLKRRGLIEVQPDPDDRRGRVMALTAKGRKALAAAAPIWKEHHAAVETELQAAERTGAELDVPVAERLRQALRVLAKVAR